MSIYNTKKYIVKFPTTEQLGSFKYVVSETMYETKEQCALWHYNNALEHDAIAPVAELPKGVVFEDYVP